MKRRGFWLRVSFCSARKRHHAPVDRTGMNRAMASGGDTHSEVELRDVFSLVDVDIRLTPANNVRRNGDAKELSSFSLPAATRSNRLLQSETLHTEQLHGFARGILKFLTQQAGFHLLNPVRRIPRSIITSRLRTSPQPFFDLHGSSFFSPNAASFLSIGGRGKYGRRGSKVSASRRNRSARSSRSILALELLPTFPNIQYPSISGSEYPKQNRRRASSRLLP